METVKFGRTGLDVSPICLGAMSFGDPENWIHDWVLNEEDSRQVIRESLDLGIIFLIQPTFILKVRVNVFLEVH